MADCNHNHYWQKVKDYNGQLTVSKNFVETYQAATGLIKWKDHINVPNPGTVAGKIIGTGILISKNLFLTARHGFNSSLSFPRDPRIPNSTPSLEFMVKHIEICFDFLENISSAVKINIARVCKEKCVYCENPHNDSVIDYLLLELEGFPGNRFTTIKLASQDPAVNTTLCIIGHPYDGEPKTIAPGIVKSISGNLIYHDIDTREGYSGSGILSVNGDKGNLVGIHLEGDCFGNLNNNRGIRSTVLREELAEFI
ncbi:MAG: Uncharacterized protein FD167_3482 [bacterium]|nr:MAG: Uncharacterized protein FD167_3482 [bacterium]